MVVLSSASGFYTGKAGLGWVSPNQVEAFAYSRTEGSVVAARLNKATSIHGLTFSVEEV